MQKFILVLCFVLSLGAWAQNKDLVYSLNAEGTNYVKFTFTNQLWLRFTDNNPGTTVYGTRERQTYDIGLRRTRMQLMAQLSDKVFVYSQFGQNNLSYNSIRKQGIYFLDVTSEYKLAKDALTLGGGLTGWSGLARYASPSVVSILTLDAPLYQQSTNDVTDQFLRKFSLYAKGKLGKLDYRLALSKPMSLQNSSVQSTTIGKNASFSAEPGKMQVQGYFMYQFLDKESNLIPYNVGCYLGKKKVFNIGAGFIAQNDAMWRISDNGLDTLRSALKLYNVDVFYDAPINKEKGSALTIYASAGYMDYGKNYLRNLGVMNPANGTIGTASANGAGNAFPMLGTGSTYYAQIGYLLGDKIFKSAGTLQLVLACQYSNFQALKIPMVMYEGGLNWLISGHKTKLSLNYQNRPVYLQNPGGDYFTLTRKGMLVMQYQLAF